MVIAKRSLAALALGLAASLAPAVAVASPALDPQLLYRLRPFRRTLACGAIGLAALTAITRPSPGRIALVPVTAALSAAAFLYPEKVFVPLDRPAHILADEAVYGDDAPVLGFATADAAVAWPIEVLVPHHLVNDVVGGLPVLATYCPLCRTGIVFDPTVDQRALTFEVAGLVRGNMLMRDHETGTIWQQSTGEALAGPLQGCRLELLLGEQTTWSAWRDDYPQTTLCAEPTSADKGIIRFLPFDRMTAHFAHGAVQLPGQRGRDQRLPSREEVAGLTIAGESRAYALNTLAATGGVGDRLGGQSILVAYDRSADRARAFTHGGGQDDLAIEAGQIVERAGGGRWSLRGEPLGDTNVPLGRLPVERQWWMSWAEFHPATTVYTS